MKKKLTSLLIVLLLCFACTASVFADSYSYTIISPQVSTSGVTYCDNLLISIKVAQNKSIAVELFKYPKFGTGDTLSTITTDTLSEKTSVTPRSTFRSGSQINFYTNQLNEISPGLYSLKVDVLDSSGNVVSSENNFFIVKSAGEMQHTNLFETQPSTTMQFFQNLFRGLFGVV